jgi:NADPH:quinone reductase-like Zn-dependent oxidoreductase
MVTLAVEAGARVIATASASDAEYCRALGAAGVLDYKDPDLAARIRDAAPHGVDAHLDTSGRNDLTTAVELLAPRGRIVLLAGARTRTGRPPAPGPAARPPGCRESSRPSLRVPRPADANRQSGGVVSWLCG